MANKLGILAGGGPLPGYLIRACRDSARDVFVVAFENHADPDIVAEAPHEWVRLGAAGATLDLLRRHGVREVVLAGPVGRPKLRDLRPDGRGLELLSKGLLNKGDDGVLRTVIDALEREEGYKVIGVDDVLAGVLAPAGILGTLKPDGAAQADIGRGVSVLRALGAADVGQAVVVQQGVVLGIEAVEGTDALLARCAGLRRDGAGGVLVKLPKSSQDRRADLPAVGPGTIRCAADAGLGGIAVAAGACLLFERTATIEAADGAGLFLVGIDPDA